MHLYQVVLLIVGGPAIAWSVFSAVRDAFHARRAARDLPVVARELGLRMKRTRRLPELHGEVDGFEVAIDHEEITVTLDVDTPWFAQHMSYELPPPYSWLLAAMVKKLSDGAPAFDFADRGLDRFFSVRTLTRKATKAAIPEGLRMALRQFVDRHGKQSHLYLGRKIQCAPRLGHSGPPRTHAISGAQVRELLPDLLMLAKAIEVAYGPRRRDER